MQEYPHLAILDPRTGRKIWSKEGWTMEHPVTAESFLEIVMDFGDRNSFDKPPSAPPAPKSKRSHVLLISFHTIVRLRLGEVRLGNGRAGFLKNDELQQLEGGVAH